MKNPRRWALANTALIIVAFVLLVANKSWSQIVGTGVLALAAVITAYINPYQKGAKKVGRGTAIFMAILVAFFTAITGFGTRSWVWALVVALLMGLYMVLFYWHNNRVIDQREKQHGKEVHD
ncbi:hypothetical protein OZX65_06405 [Leuconostocaceae bacterium ESL0723]|nr:hypothetical protein OZX65_06405 [Leuconostocaceae bacterium ESL0723]